MENIKQHQEMGYDRSSGMFSPDGLILQVEYAEKAVQLGATVLAMTTKEGVVFIGDRKISSKLLVKDSYKKVFEIDSHIGVTGAGAMSDGRRLIEEAQNIAQKHRTTYHDAMDILPLVKDIANIQQYYSQSGGLRPFGVALLIGGMDAGKPVLYQTTPSGMYIQFLARSVGSLSNKINEKLEEKYSDKLDNKKAIALGLDIFKEVLGDEFSKDRFDIAQVTSSGFERL
jgi:proteasome alpha subunit